MVNLRLDQTEVWVNHRTESQGEWETHTENWSEAEEAVAGQQLESRQCLVKRVDGSEVAADMQGWRNKFNSK